MLLSDVIKGLDVVSVVGDLDVEIKDVQYDSRKVSVGTLFVCVKGFVSDGHKYINSAIEKGAKAFLVEEDVFVEGCTFVRVDNSRMNMAKVADNFYNHPSTKFDVLGVTGTNGKTSITTFLNEILTRAQKKVGLIGTIKIFDGIQEVTSSSTTPESIDLQHTFDNMLNNKCDYCAMEVSSHSLALNRVEETKFKLGIFTNLTPDHLDFHKDLEDYRQTKEKLFFMTTGANIINIDDEGGQKIYENIKDLDTPCYTYGIENKADFMAKDIKSDSDGVSYRLITPTYEEVIFVPVPGMFTVYNTLAVIAACYNLGIDKSVYKEGLRVTKGVSGRFETVPNDRGMSVIVDYAHTPDALENVLKTSMEFAKGRVISVFGCGGDRDSEKRPLMGEIGQKYSDVCFITSDNPRTEDPNTIIEDVLKGIDINVDNYNVVVDRKDAIEKAVAIAKEGDVVIITGKGHEDYQIIGTTKHHFDDKEVAKDFLDSLDK
ncbi:UDP-N-acetylmuramoyl-L-alanyl-D-glutamate--2,6-diaminopimelate ligase [Metaclostridioides mangenotii]|uniref:UDP-N-acetylmuramoyl-L-alanyl-D-glutamate--2, 6-diaminopimelate ligase n=1 Tax=Metaclostridioides mangenotii TaxID=1540 RepID=UPI0026F29519|nr:UDP-N-acetylmuramoyl-L-alanyl-D-glutamate--2,6-diaminopimelate ligase [Clostridioides mangenotii]